MARVTTEDCLQHIDNHFQLVLVASHRARQLLAGSEPKVEREGHKSTVLALCEIGEGKISESILQEPIAQKDITAEDFKGLFTKPLTAENENEGEMKRNMGLDTAGKETTETHQLKKELSQSLNTEQYATSDEKAITDVETAMSLEEALLSDKEPNKSEVHAEDTVLEEELATKPIADMHLEEVLQSEEENAKSMDEDESNPMMMETPEEGDEIVDLNFDKEKEAAHSPEIIDDGEPHNS